jgi:hypothetical protein
MNIGTVYNKNKNNLFELLFFFFLSIEAECPAVYELRRKLDDWP